VRNHLRYDVGVAKDEELGAALRLRVQTFIRRFGLLRDAETPCGVPLPLSHAHALTMLLERAGRSESTRQKDLAEALDLDKSSVARLCRRMEASGHVVRARDDQDGRARAIQLTAKGKRVAREVESASRERFERVLATIPRNEQRRVLAALDVLTAAVAASPPEENDR
jgi:DNA-binding MarR family transcriptional regulator